jgi:predicted RNase H-like HicB family nuclease
MKRRKQMPKATRQIILHVPVKIFKEGDYMVAYCPVLEVASCGKTVEEAKRAFDGAIRIFIEETTKRGTLEKELLSLGWTLRQEPSCKYQPPASRRSLTSIRRLKPADIVKEYDEKVRITCDSSARTPAYAGSN